MNKDDNKKIRITPRMRRDQVEFLDHVSRDCKFSGGRALGHTEVVRSMVAAMREIDPDLSGVRTEDELVARILGANRRVK